MKPYLKEYSEAVEAHLDALSREMQIKLEVRNTYHRLMRAKEELRAKEREMIEDSENLHI